LKETAMDTAVKTVATTPAKRVDDPVPPGRCAPLSDAS